MKRSSFLSQPKSIKQPNISFTYNLTKGNHLNQEKIPFYTQTDHRKGVIKDFSYSKGNGEEYNDLDPDIAADLQAFLQ